MNPANNNSPANRPNGRPARNASAAAYEVTFKITSPLQRLLLEKSMLMAQELEAVGAAAPWGHILDHLEEAAVQKGRDLTAAALQEAAQQQIDAQEKKLRSAAAPAGRCDTPKEKTRVDG
jgi:hypothetical protein